MQIFSEVIFPTHRVSSSVGNRPTFRLHYAILLSKSHEWEQAVAIYRGAISKFESDIANHPPYQMFDFDSESVNSSLLESSAHILIGLFESGFTQPTPQENLAHFKEAARLEPNLAIVQFYYGYGLEHVGKNPAAKAAYQKAIRYSDRDSYLQLKAKEFLNTVGQKGWFTPEPPKAAGKPEKKP